MRQLLFRFAIAISIIFVFSYMDAQEIRIGQPKAWRYDRMFPVEDGLLRDVEGININTLTGLDASELNSRVVDLLQTFVSASVNFDQTAGIQNAIARDAFNITRGAQFNQLKDQAATAQALADQKAQIAKALVAAIDTQTKAKQAGCLGTTCTDAQNQIIALNEQLKAINDASTAVGPISLTPPSPPSLSGVSGGPPITTPAVTPLISGSSDFIKNALANDPKTVLGSLPARERLQNFITLLNDRLTHQLALSLDERGLGKEYVPVVLQLDVAIEPNSNRKEQKAVSEFTLSAPGCNNKKPIVYNLYPSLAAFNVSEVQGQSSGFLANGAFKGLFLGSNISFQRQHDHIMAAMAQSVYISGFRQSDNTFGWYYGAPAYSKMVRPGIYTTFAVVLIPKRAGASQDEDNVCNIQLNATTHWEKKNGKIDSKLPFNNLIKSTGDPILPDNHPPLVRQVQYWPHYGQKSDLQKVSNVVAIEFEQPVDPNLLITASGKLLKRVRDWRGRATTPPANDTISINDSTGNAHSVSIGRGLLESNYDEADTWIAVSQKRILVKLSYDTAGPIDFPSIRLLVPGGGDLDLRDAVDFKSYASRISIGDRTFYACHPKLAAYDPNQGNEGCMKQPNSLWLPLFLETPEKNHKLRVVKIRAIDSGADIAATAATTAVDNGARFLNAAMRVNAMDQQRAANQEGRRDDATEFDAPDNSRNGPQQYIFLSLDDAKLRLSPGSQVLLVAPAHSRFAHPIAMECAPLASGLLCHLHPQTITFNTPVTVHAAVTSKEDSSKIPKDQNAGETAVENAPCLTEINGALQHNSTSEFCNWRNYRLQVVVTQTGNETEGTRTILAAADFPTSPKTLPIIGPARTAQQLTAGAWQVEFPVWYGAQFLSGGQRQVCVGNETGEELSGAKANLIPDPLGDLKRASVLMVTIPRKLLSDLLFSSVFLYECEAVQEKSDQGIIIIRYPLNTQLGPLSGVDRLILPDNLVLTKAGTDSSFYQFTGTNTERVKQVTLGKAKKYSVEPHPVRGGFIADLSVQTKTPEESLLYFEIGGLQVPATACWNTDPKGPQVCGQVVIKTTAAGPITIAPVKVENPVVSKNPAAETPASKVSVRPD